jgi:hypothetical protein
VAASCCPFLISGAGLSFSSLCCGGWYQDGPIIHALLSATGGLCDPIIAMLAYFFRHTRSIRNRPAVGGQSSNSRCCWNLLAAQGVASMWYVVPFAVRGSGIPL